MDATARTGNVPVPRTGAGIALNQAPSTGTAARFVKCSQIGMPAPSSPECAGRVRSAGSSMLSESIPTIAAPDSTSRSTAAAVRNGLSRPYASLPQWRSCPVWIRTARPAEVVGEERSRVDGARTRACHVDAHRRNVDEPLERQFAEILPVGEAVERAVDVRPGIAAQGDDVDREGHAGCVVGRARLAGEVRPDLGHREAGVGRHALDDRMAEVDEASCAGRLAVRRRRFDSRACAPPRGSAGFESARRRPSAAGDRGRAHLRSTRR